jgi:4'-phosphopantetheinyl transferase
MVRIFVMEVGSRITAEIFIQRIANNHLGIAREKLIIDKNKYGKPFLVHFPNIHYNVSHTKGLIVCAISNHCVGIDVERIKPFNKPIVERFFSRNECEYVFVSKENQDKRFAEIWTKKEAYVKWLGKGMEVPFESFDVCHEGAENLYSFSWGHYYISVFSEKLVQINVPEVMIENSDSLI